MWGRVDFGGYLPTWESRVGQVNYPSGQEAGVHVHGWKEDGVGWESEGHGSSPTYLTGGVTYMIMGEGNWVGQGQVPDTLLSWYYIRGE